MDKIVEYLIRAQIRDGMKAPSNDALGAALEVGTEDPPAELGFDAVEQWTVHDAPTGYVLDDREHATVLAALRYWQSEGLINSVHEIDVATNCGTLLALTDYEIDALCERLNTGGAV